jgi:integrase
MDRARQVGASAPEHYLIPARVEEVKTALDGKTRRIRGFDPNRPTKGWRSAWRKLTESAGLKGLRGHDLRHNWVTLHAENGTPQSVLTEVRQGSASLRLFERWEGEK